MDSDHTELIPLSDPGGSFDIVRRGYDRAQVEEHVERLEAELRIAAADRDAAASRSADLASQLGATHAEVESLRAKLEQTGLPTFENMGERIAGMLRLAEAEADAIRAKAVEDTAAQRAELDRLSEEVRAGRDGARSQAAVVVADAEERARATQDDADAYARAVRADADAYSQGVRGEADAYALATRGTADDHARSVSGEAETYAQQLRTDAQHDRDQADNDFEIALRARRTEESRRDQERRAQSIAEAEQRIAEADAEARRLVAEARRQVDELTVARSQVLDQLVAVRRLIEDIPDRAGIDAGNQPPQGDRGGWVDP